MEQDSALVAPAASEAQTTETPEESTSATVPPKLHLHFLDLNGDDIADLGVRVTIWDQPKTYCTDAKGLIDDIEGPADARLRIEVQRFDGSFKLIDDCLMPASANTWWQYLSPQLLLDVETEEHQGEKGDIEQSIPVAVPADLGERPVVQTGDAPVSAPPTPEAATSTAAKPAPTQAPAPSPAPKSDPAQAPVPATTPTAAKASTPSRTTAAPAAALPAISGKTATPPRESAVKTGRTEQGNPMVVLQHKVLDWWNSWHLPSLNLWAPHANAPSAPPAMGGAASTEPATGSKVPYNLNMLPKVKGLIEFATAQTEYDYSVGTAAVVAQMVKGTFQHASGEKKSTTSVGKCYQYVRIALTRAQIVEGYLADGMDVTYQESASKAGQPLLKKGFVDVTDEVPDPRWAAVGDIIVYEWSPGTWEARKKKKNLASLPNHGHIDIRSEENYISDFMPGKLEEYHQHWISGDATEPTKFRPEYINIRIYRKFYDPTPTCRIRAFLACLREFECQAVKNDTDRYHALNTPLPATPKSKDFVEFNSHPWSGIPKDQWPASTAAGAYQITCTTWRDEMDHRYFMDAEGKATFSPQMQDRIAVRRLEFRGALHLLRSGKIEEAVAAARKEWTSLPGSTENAKRRTADGKPMDMAYFKGLFDRFLAAELNKFGIRN